MAPNVTLVNAETLSGLEATLLNTSGKVPLHNRYRALFTLKALKSEEAIIIIQKCFQDPNTLLKHELAYVLGQMGNIAALPVLEDVVADLDQDPMVRHEAVEALGALGYESSLPCLEKYINDPASVVRETVEIAIDRIKWSHTEEGKAHKAMYATPSDHMYTSIDPAPPTTELLAGKGTSQAMSDAAIEKLKARLLDTKLPLFDRYRAMFSLRNIGTSAAVDALAAGFDDESALFKHEIAFVFGQLLSPDSVPYLIKVLNDTNEAPVVRHEAAEALGGIATPEVLPHLKTWAERKDSPDVLKDSCVVALDMYEYENSSQFQYADGLGQGATAPISS